ncbi:MAG TPA: hypothetical protein VM032_16130, partial [Vicinamibacterales bacterium]|nr:hypothetical protein [Vicinamibacterales bacterium]
MPRSDHEPSAESGPGATATDRLAGALAPLLEVVASLERFYGPLPAPPDDPFRCYVWEALSTQTTAGRRDAAYAALHRIPALTPDAMFRAPRVKLARAVALAGPYQEQRLQALLEGVERFRRQARLAAIVRGPVRAARRALATLPRLGNGSVHRQLLFGGNHCVFPVDREMTRVCTRLGLGGGADGRPGSGRRLRHVVEGLLPR